MKEYNLIIQQCILDVQCIYNKQNKIKRLEVSNCTTFLGTGGRISGLIFGILGSGILHCREMPPTSKWENKQKNINTYLQHECLVSQWNLASFYYVSACPMEVAGVGGWLWGRLYSWRWVATVAQ